MAKFRVKCKTKAQRMLEKEIRRFTYQVKNREKLEEKREAEERERQKIINNPAIQEEIERWSQEFRNILGDPME